MNSPRDRNERPQKDLSPVARPEESTGSVPGPLRQPLETIALAMKAQADLLRQMHERQRTLEDVVRDEKRHELVVNSAQSLNDAFRGMQQSQERLADRLEDSKGGGMSAARWALIAIVLLGVVAALVILVAETKRGSESLGTFAQKLDAPRVDAEARAALSAIEARMGRAEAADRSLIEGEFDRLRKAVDAASAERESLKRERDQAREDLGALRGKAAEAEKLVVELKTRQESADKEIARLTTQSIADQRLVAQMNGAMEVLRSRGGGAPAVGAPVAAAAPETAGTIDPATITAAMEKIFADREAEGGSATTQKTEGGEPVEGAAPKDDPREQTFSPGLREDFNGLLARHRGPAKYSLVSAGRIYDKKLRNAVVEVRGADGSLDKTIEAEAMTAKISPRGEMLEIEFEGGHVVFHGSGSGSGRDAKSPFFNNRYQIVLLGAPVKDWLSAGLSFVSMK